MDFQYLIDQWIEPLATVISIIYLYLEINEKKALWIFGILSSGLYAYVFFKSSFYADFTLNIYYVIISIYGWIHWQGKQNSTDHVLPIKRITSKQIVLLIIGTTTSYFLLLMALLYIPEYFDLASSAFPYVDALVVAASISATWMLSQKIMEHWYVWIFGNAISIAMFGLKGLYFTSGLYLVYTIGSIIGLQTWKKNFASQHTNHA
jgi:nicotinamide mononucleotide transporter